MNNETIIPLPRKVPNIRVQFLINELVNHAQFLTSEYPLKAARARTRVEQLKQELLEHLTAETRS